ncbi:ubiquinol-cytochrome C chaperone [Agrobacterium vitis]|uniref:ubiquinol-cytochrome C chaperone family protein n=1 Tax=Rhizobium/Agrobacterium group TaxID=227290 RepID=UPI0008DC0989|nr:MULTISPECIES: ubiquinol-cytochrome C chaperone family protein [Rhizobium/Agrobacterium group]MCF1434283.1 ubiquinol-cytochrome C chaperone [Allorhizobium ampelinum]MUO89565.1 ubiquinol-cytochrome C chaperone [Agrobacterium vitis]MUZ51707.1 ubiquinol-cytochrome C chaperone [Agrobacterium vitis]MUZ90076.1 ubiquinol-cytochrome C chaperone [Agrobacterium vitis]MVA39309.1 ubiquinol-cytochrome C chaperone [Agrobacterium vitis]
MIFTLFKTRRNNRQIIDRQYAVLMEAARVPLFYEALDVPDTVMGRFEMLSLVLILYLRRTAKSERSGQEVAQEIIDAFFQDVDHSIRELGVGDQTVPKRMKKLAGMFYGRLETYGKALDLKDESALAAGFRRNIHPDVPEAARPAMTDLAQWAITAETYLLQTTEEAVITGSLAFPLPEQQVHR